MNICKKVLVVVFVTTMLGSALPTYADVINTSFKQGGATNSKLSLKTQKNIKCKTKGRNRSASKAIKANLRTSTRNFTKCTVSSQKVASFKNPKIGGLRIDACVRGIGWSQSDPKRCDHRRLKKIVTEFCKSKGFKKSYNYTKVSHKGKHAVLTYRKSKPKHSFWKKRQGRMLVKNIVCKQVSRNKFV